MNQHERDKKAYLTATPMQRDVVRRLLTDVLACLRAQYLSYQTSHWQVVGGSFYGNHLLFDRLYQSVQEQVDQLAEKIAGYLGGDALDLNRQVEAIYNFTLDWGRISCHHKRGIRSEEDLQEAIRVAYEGIKGARAMTLGLDDWLMATANSHEENTYLLQQTLTEPLTQKQAGDHPMVSHKEAQKIAKDLLSRIEAVGYLEASIAAKKMRVGGFEFGDHRSAMKTLKFHAKGTLPFGVESAAEPLHWIAQDELQDYQRVLRVAEGAARKKRKRGSGAPTAEDAFYDDPEKKEVLEFSQSNAISNNPEIAEKASEQDNMDVSEAKAVAEADEAPPTPDEIKDEPGGAAFSTLNRYVIQTEVPGEKKVVQMNKDRMARWSEELL